MLSLPDFREKSVVFIFNEHQKIRYSNENLVVEDIQENKVLSQVSCYKIFAVFLVGDMSITTKLMENLMKHGVTLFFLKRNMRFLSAMGNQSEGNYLVRLKQYAYTANEALSKWIIQNKISNQQLLLKSIREKSESQKKSLVKITDLLESLQREKNLSTESLSGIEGNCSRFFFKAWFEKLEWRRRLPRVKEDELNCLLDIGYTYLFNLMESMLRLYGFDLYIGFHHKLFFRRKSLVCDMVEPFRCVIDKAVLKGLNLGQLKKEWFVIEKKSCYLPWKHNKDVTLHFSRCLLEHKEDIFLYVQNFYRSFMKDRPIESYPVFDFKSEEVHADNLV